MSKSSSSVQGKKEHKGTITQYLSKDTYTPKTSTSSKHLCSSLSPSEKEKSTKKAIMAELNTATQIQGKIMDSKTDDKPKEDTSIAELKGVISPLVEEVKMLRETIHTDIKELQNVVKTQQKDISRLEESLDLSQQNVKGYLMDKINQNTVDIQ